MFKRLSISRLTLVFAFLAIPFAVHAQNTAGGEISYKFLYKQVTPEFVFNHYQLTVKLYKECQDPSALPYSITISAARINPPPVTPTYDGGTPFQQVTQSGFYITKQDQNSCSPSQQPICYYVGVYTTEISLIEDWGETLIYVQADRRKSANFINVSTDGLGKLSAGIMGYTYTCTIPNMLLTRITRQPSSPVFKKRVSAHSLRRQALSL